MWRVRRLLSGRDSTSSEPDYHDRIHDVHRARIRSHFARFGEIGRSHQVPILVVVVPVFRYRPGAGNPWADIHAWISDLCAENGLQFLDLYESFRGRNPAAVAFDIWHPNETGHAVIAEALAAYVEDSWSDNVAPSGLVASAEGDREGE